MVIKIHLWLNHAIQAGVNIKTNSRHLHMNENGLHQSLTGNMKNKDLPLFITSSTIRCNAMASVYVSVLLVLLIAGNVLLSHSYSK